MKVKRLSIIIAFFIILGSFFVVCQISLPELSVSPYPAGLNFAFTITDDPDGTKIEKIKDIYALLDKLGFKTTIACWISKPVELDAMPDPEDQFKSATVTDKEYFSFLKHYQEKGFEIALHTVSAGHDKRENTILGYEKFKALFNHYPKINIMHSKNKEDIYWGRNVFRNPIMRMLVGIYDKTPFQGEYLSSSYFWGDICKKKTKYVRLWGTSDINTLKFNPSMPYHDPDKPYVNYWFSFSDGYKGSYFNTLLSLKNIKRLVQERGACIVYTHFAAGFCQKQKDGSYLLNEQTKEALLNLSRQKEGWFVPASELLDRLLDIKNVVISKKGKKITVVNSNSGLVKDITLKTRPFMEYSDGSGGIFNANGEGEIMLGDLRSNEKKIIFLTQNVRILASPIAPDFCETAKLIIERMKILILVHKG